MPRLSVSIDYQLKLRLVCSNVIIMLLERRNCQAVYASRTEIENRNVAQTRRSSLLHLSIVGQF